ncbi:MAG: zinc-binding alcohol dehydrogenase family protein [Chloroflexia bacterium]
MKAAVVEGPGGPEVLRVTEVPTPEARPGWVLVRVRGAGLNRSEMFTRQGHSPGVRFPRVLGIELVGEVADGSDSGLPAGQKVAVAMGGLGRQYDGGYAEYALVPTRQVFPLETELPWETLAAIPETFLTAWGSVVEAMEVAAGQTLLVRGGTSALGMAATLIAKDRGARVTATTRNPDKLEALRANGADDVIIDEGSIAQEARRRVPEGFDGTLELVGTVTLLDSLRTVRRRGVVCMSGILGNAWTLAEFEPLVMIPPTVRLTVYDSETLTGDNGTRALQQIVDAVGAGRYRVNVDRVFRLDEIAEAHRHMEENRAAGKLVVLMD